MAVDRVERLLLEVSGALRDSNVDYAIVGGNAVAAWVATVDDSAVRATKDVDIVLRASDLPDAAKALKRIDLIELDVMGVRMFVDRKNPNPKTGVHILIANELVRPHYGHPAPDPAESVEAEGGVRVIALNRLVEMKLQANRFVDRVHVQDLMEVGLIDQSVRDALPPDLRERLRQIEAESDQ